MNKHNENLKITRSTLQPQRGNILPRSRGGIWTLVH